MDHTENAIVNGRYHTPRGPIEARDMGTYLDACGLLRQMLMDNRRMPKDDMAAIGLVLAVREVVYGSFLLGLNATISPLPLMDLISGVYYDSQDAALISDSDSVLPWYATEYKGRRSPALDHLDVVMLFAEGVVEQARKRLGTAND
jgi:hypothetical protein